jgi:hypothetical protein
MTASDTPLIPPRESFWTRLARFRRGPWEAVATTVIAAGVVMLMQPLALVLYTYSFVTILVGTLMFVIVSHFKD